jgi:hypothetical protein
MRSSSQAAFPCLVAFLTAGGALMASCASNKELPSDRPFDASQYNANPQSNSPQNASSEGLVSTPAPVPSPTKAADGSVPFKFSVTCIDPTTNQSYAATDAGYDACVMRKQESQQAPRR